MLGVYFSFQIVFLSRHYTYTPNLMVFVLLSKHSLVLFCCIDRGSVTSIYPRFCSSCLGDGGGLLKVMHRGGCLYDFTDTILEPILLIDTDTAY